MGTAAKHGEEQVKIWRRSFDTPPPPMEPDHPYYETIRKDPRYAEEPKPEEFPMFESLKLTIDRTLPYWNNVIVPQIKEGKKILIAAHGNPLRGIVKHLDNMSDSDIMGLNLPTGIPFIYELDENMKPLKSMQFLGDEETVRKAMESVANQGKAKKAEPAPEVSAPEAPAAAPETPAPIEPAPEMPVSMVAHTVGNLKPPMEPIRVVITGAAGQIGYSLIFMVGSGYVFGQDQPIILHLLDVEPAMGVLGGVVMEIQDCAMPLVKGVVPTADPAVAFKDADAAFMVGAMPRREGMERKDLLAANVRIFKVQGECLDKYAKKSVKVMVVGNPANTNALICSHYAPSIPKETFSAMTRLDQNRAASQLALKVGARVQDVRKMTIWGNHSSTQFPDAFHATINGKSVVSLINNDAWIQNEFIPIVQKRGAAVIAARKLSSAMSAAKAACDHMKSWVQGTPVDDWVSMGVFSDGSYSTPKGVMFSFPVTCSGGKWKIVQGLSMSEFAMGKLAETGKET